MRYNISFIFRQGQESKGNFFWTMFIGPDVELSASLPSSGSISDCSASPFRNIRRATGGLLPFPDEDAMLSKGDRHYHNLKISESRLSSIFVNHDIGKRKSSFENFSRPTKKQKTSLPVAYCISAAIRYSRD